MQPCEEVDTGVDVGRNETALTSAEPRRPGRVRVRSLAARAAAVLLAAVAALLALPLQAQAQTEVWSSTLTVRDNVGVLGCSNFFTNNHCSVHLSDDDFTHDSTDYAITIIFLRTNGRLEVNLDTNLTTATQALTLNIDGTAFAFEDADTKGINFRNWNNSGLSWTAGNTVSLTLTEAEADTTPPALSTGHQVDATGRPIYLIFDEDLDGTNLPPASAFTVTAAGAAVPVTLVQVGTGASSATLLLDLAAFIGEGWAVTVSYTDPTSGDDAAALQDAAGNDVASFSNLAITNNSTVDTTPPSPESAAVATSGTSVSVTFNEDLDIAVQFLPAAVVDAFTLTADGVDLDIDRVSAPATNALLIRLPTGTTISQSQTVKLSYDKTVAGADALEDAAGNEVASFSNVAVTNNSTVDITPPRPESAAVATSGTSVSVTFDKDLDLAVEFLPAAVVDAFTVTADGVDLDIDRVSVPATNALLIRLPTGTTISQSQTVKLSYDKTVAGADALEDAAGNEVASFTDVAVTNNSTVALDTTLSTGHGLVSIADASANENDDFLMFEVTLSRSFPNTVKVDFETISGGTATEGVDYWAHDYTHVIPAGETTVQMGFALIADTVDDAGETVKVRLSNARLIDGYGDKIADLDITTAEATGTINAPSTSTTTVPGLTIGIKDATGREDNGWLVFKVRLSQKYDDYVCYDFETISGGTATEGTDYIKRPKVRHWVQIRKRVDKPFVRIIDDSVNDDGETVKVKISNARLCNDASQTLSITRAEATGTIRNTEEGVSEPDPLTASFTGVPESHDGASAFTFGLTFSEEVKLSYRTLRDEAFNVGGGAVRKAKRRQQGSNQGWTITVEPDGSGAVAIQLPETSNCNASGAICTAAGQPLSHSLSKTVAGPVGISVADARVDENEGAALSFAVTLSRAASGPVTVEYATSDGTATAGVDYTATSGTLTFQSGDTSKTISVAVLDDSHDEGEETLTLSLSNASGGRVTDGEATGTIENRDPMPRAFLARFGRAAAVHVVEHVEERIQAQRKPGTQARFAGQELRRDTLDEMALGLLSRLGASVGANRSGAGLQTPMAAGPMDAAAGPEGGLDRREHSGMGLGGGDLLTGSAFVLNHETGRGGVLSFWSRGGRSSFNGREGDLSLDGRVRTTMFGADYAKGPLVMGLSLANSRGRGGYAGVDIGEVVSSVTGLYPWLGYQVTDRLTVWGVTGYGKGALTLTPGEGTALKSGLSMAMAAGGLRGDLADSLVGGFGLAFKADVLWVGTGIEGMEGPRGASGSDRCNGNPFADRAGDLARLQLWAQVVAATEPGGRAAARRRGRRDGSGRGLRRRFDRIGHLERAVGRRAGADAAGASGRRVLRAGRVAVVQLQPDAVHGAGLHSTTDPVLGRTGDERRRGAVGPGDDGGHDRWRARERQPPRCGGRLRVAGGKPLRGNAEARPEYVRAWPGLPVRLQPRGAQPGESGLRAGHRCAAAREPEAGQRGQRVPRPGHAALVDPCREPACAASKITHQRSL